MTKKCEIRYHQIGLFQAQNHSLFLAIYIGRHTALCIEARRTEAPDPKGRVLGVGFFAPTNGSGEH